MSIGEIANSVIELPLAGKLFKVKQVPMTEIYGNAEARIVESYLKNVNTIASTLNGADKLNYLASATKGVIKGAELSASANEYIESGIGMINLFKLILNKLQTVSDEEVNDLFIRSTIEEKQIMLSYVSGSGSIKVGAKEGETEVDKKK